MTLVPILILVAGLFIMALSVPLIRRKVPMNPYYGFRVAASLESPERWYSINAYSARVLAQWTLLPIVTGVLGLFLPGEWAVEYSLAAPLSLVCNALIPTVLTFRWIKRTYGKKEDGARSDVQPHLRSSNRMTF